MYNKIANLLVTVLPDEWKNVAMYAHVKEDMYEIFFFVKKDGNYYNCFKLEKEFGISRKSIMACFDEIYEIMLPDYMEKKWYCATVELSNDGKFVMEYCYDDHSEDEEQFKTIWKSKYLK